MALILCTDDSPTSRALIRSIVESQSDHVIIEAGTAEEAMRCFEDRRDGGLPDLVLMDYSMPGGSGLEAIRSLKSRPATAGVPIIMVTSSRESTTLRQAFSAGAVDFVPKPLDPAELMARIGNVLRLHDEIRLRRAREKELEAQAWELARANALLQTFSLLDPLLQIANRRAFENSLQAEWDRHISSQRPLSLLLVDVDGFKQINDRYGHPVGDACLKSIAAVLQTRKTLQRELLARFGGDEFALLLPGYDAAAALVVAEEALEAVRRSLIPDPSAPATARLSVSIGVGTMVPREPGETNSLVALSDSALYAAKREGRDRVRCASA